MANSGLIFILLSPFTDEERMVSIIPQVLKARDEVLRSEQATS